MASYFKVKEMNEGSKIKIKIRPLIHLLSVASRGFVSFITPPQLALVRV